MLINTLSELEETGKVGDWCFIGENDIFLRHPMKEIREWWPGDNLMQGSIVHLIVNDPKRKPSWKWNGDREKPTLSPSVRVIGYWHGFLENGELRTVGWE